MKKQLRQLLVQGELDQIATLAQGRTRVLGSLVSLTFDSDPLIVWRSIDALGAAAKQIAEEDPDTIRELLRRLFWLICEESGGICWHAPEAMAEIVVQVPGQFATYVPIIMHLLQEMAEEDLDHFRPGILWAIGRMGHLTDQYVPDVLSLIVEAIEHHDPQVRGIAVWCLMKIGRAQHIADQTALLADNGQVDLYEDGAITRVMVSDLVQRAMGEVSQAE